MCSSPLFSFIRKEVKGEEGWGGTVAPKYKGGIKENESL